MTNTLPARRGRKPGQKNTPWQPVADQVRAYAQELAARGRPLPLLRALVRAPHFPTEVTAAYNALTLYGRKRVAKAYDRLRFTPNLHADASA